MYIYDDPDLLFDTQGCPKSPEPYIIARTVTKGQATLQHSLVADPAGCSTNHSGCNDSEPYSEPLYMPVDEDYTEMANLPTVYNTPSSLGCLESQIKLREKKIAVGKPSNVDGSQPATAQQEDNTLL